MAVRGARNLIRTPAISRQQSLMVKRPPNLADPSACGLSETGFVEGRDVAINTAFA